MPLEIRPCAPRSGCPVRYRRRGQRVPSADFCLTKLRRTSLTESSPATFDMPRGFLYSRASSFKRLVSSFAPSTRARKNTLQILQQGSGEQPLLRVQSEIFHGGGRWPGWELPFPRPDRLENFHGRLVLEPVVFGCNTVSSGAQLKVRDVQPRQLNRLRFFVGQRDGVATAPREAVEQGIDLRHHVSQYGRVRFGVSIVVGELDVLLLAADPRPDVLLLKVGHGLLLLPCESLVLVLLLLA